MITPYGSRVTCPCSCKAAKRLAAHLDGIREPLPSSWTQRDLKPGEFPLALHQWSPRFLPASECWFAEVLTICRPNAFRAVGDTKIGSSEGYPRMVVDMIRSETPRSTRGRKNTLS